MAHENTPLKDYYFLKNRDSLSIDPWQDSAQFFGSQDIVKRIQRRIVDDFLQPRGVPKFFVFGSYGSGKTHTLAHIGNLLSSDPSNPAEPIYKDIAPLVAKEQFEKIHARLLDAIGLDRIKVAAEAAADGFGGDKIQGFLSVLPFGDQALKSSQANVFRNLLFGGRQAQLSWEWLRGRKTSVDDAQTLGIQKQLSDVQDLVSCLLNVGALYKLGCKKRIVYLIDEAEAFRSVTNPDSQTELIHALRLLLENSNSYVGLILAIQAEAGQEGIGEFFSRPDILRRIDNEHGVIDLNSLVANNETAKAFMSGLLAYVVDQASAAEAIKKENLDTTAEYFPFTEDAIEALSEHIVENQERALPSSIISWMSNAAIEAWRERGSSPVHQLVTREIIEKAVYVDH